MKKSIFLTVTLTTALFSGISQVNMDKWITLNVEKGVSISMLLYAEEDNIPIKIISGSTELTKIINAESSTYHSATTDSNILTIYGDVETFYMTKQYNKVTGIDISNNVDLVSLVCNENQITKLDASKNIKLKYIYCFGNNMDACALDALFRSLTLRNQGDTNIVCIQRSTFLTNPGAQTCRDYIARGKNWQVIDDYTQEEIHNTNFTCPETGITTANTSDVILSVYPNPSDNLFNIYAEETINSIEIYDITGKKTYKKSNINATHYVVETTGLSKGMYILKVKTENAFVTEKVIIK